MKHFSIVLYSILTVIGSMAIGLDICGMEKIKSDNQQRDLLTGNPLASFITGQHAHQSDYHAQLVAQIPSLLSSDKKLVLIEYTNGIILLFDTITKQQLLTIELEAKVEDVGFSPNNKVLCIISAANKMLLYTITGQQVLQEQLKAKAEDVEFSPDSKMLYIRSADNKVCLWDTATGQQLLQVQLKAKVDAVGFSPDSKMFSILSDDNNVSL